MRIPTNVVTGFLGVGKTTAILDLLARKADGERWAVLVNEYGEVSIDHALLEGGGGDGVTVREVAGGCVCCATAPYLQVALHLLLTEAKPHRLIVETTGLGHPGALLEKLRAGYSDRLNVRATVTVVSPDDFTTPGMLENPVFREQVELADVLVLNKLDRADENVVATFQQWANGLEPPKQLIAATQSGRLEREWLDLGGSPPSLRMVEVPSEVVAISTTQVAEPSRPLRFESAGSPPACGWVFSPDDVFDEYRLLRFLGQLSGTTRLKGVFRTEGEWVAINRVGTSMTVTPTNYRRDSRVEVFADGAEWERIERGLLDCLRDQP
ncbi:CobW family GTP-binding protein [Limnoglobus roseus]|uniref:GTP-binding protein n=1 Tax=Limnoglobus roseus TaxID=2598579 RepID=A0A5C1AQT0_9BACT|nr:GTP-binding protein [Limnoglobus roseus]QEL20386.1 GTP-binding protein [Limnoglobus roseus]